MITLNIVAHVVVASVLITGFCIILFAHYASSPIRKLPNPGTVNRDCYDEYLNIKKRIERAWDLEKIESLEPIIRAYTRWYTNVGATNIKTLSAKLHSELRTKEADIKYLTQNPECYDSRNYWNRPGNLRSCQRR